MNDIGKLCDLNYVAMAKIRELTRNDRFREFFDLIPLDDIDELTDLELEVYVCRWSTPVHFVVPDTGQTYMVEFHQGIITAIVATLEADEELGDPVWVRTLH